MHLGTFHERFKKVNRKWTDPRYVQKYYKTKECISTNCRRDFTCPNYHSWADRRRDNDNYCTKGCRFAWDGDSQIWMDPKDCLFGDFCDHAHSRIEMQYHESKYKSQLCRDYAKSRVCERSYFCAFRHGDKDAYHNQPDTAADSAPIQVPAPAKPSFVFGTVSYASAMTGNPNTLPPEELNPILDYHEAEFDYGGAEDGSYYYGDSSLTLNRSDDRHEAFTFNHSAPPRGMSPSMPTVFGVDYFTSYALEPTFILTHPVVVPDYPQEMDNADELLCCDSEILVANEDPETEALNASALVLEYSTAETNNSGHEYLNQFGSPPINGEKPSARQPGMLLEALRKHTGIDIKRRQPSLPSCTVRRPEPSSLDGRNNQAQLFGPYGQAQSSEYSMFNPPEKSLPRAPTPPPPGHSKLAFWMGITEEQLRAITLEEDRQRHGLQANSILETCPEGFENFKFYTTSDNYNPLVFSDGVKSNGKDDNANKFFSISLYDADNNVQEVELAEYVETITGLSRMDKDRCYLLPPADENNNISTVLFKESEATSSSN